MLAVAHIITRGLLSTYEKRLNPALSNYPVVVLQNNRVIDYCHRAKTKGINSGMLSRHASYALPEGVFLKRRSDDFKQLFHDLLNVTASFSPRCEMYGEQEMFLDLTGEGNTDQVIQKLAQIMVPAYCEGMVISLAKTKLTARACSMVVTTLPKRSWHSNISTKKLTHNIIQAVVNCNDTSFWANLPINLLWPLEEKIIQQLQYLGISNCRQLQELSPDELARQFGSQAFLINRYSHGLDYSKVALTKNPQQLIKHYLLSGTFEQIQWEPILEKAAQDLATQLGVKMEGFRELQIDLQLDSGGVITTNKKFNRILFTASAIRTNLKSVLGRLNISDPLHGLMIYLKGLQPLPVEQLHLFDLEKNRKKKPDKIQQEKLAEVIKNLNRKYPSKVINFGRTLPVSRREQMLQLWDPYRFKKKEVLNCGQTGP